jgi:hypothetical protein
VLFFFGHNDAITNFVNKFGDVLVIMFQQQDLCRYHLIPVGLKSKWQDKENNNS